jgi:hypothetical protein
MPVAANHGAARIMKINVMGPLLLAESHPSHNTTRVRAFHAFRENGRGVLPADRRDFGREKASSNRNFPVSWERITSDKEPSR